MSSVCSSAEGSQQSDLASLVPDLADDWNEEESDDEEDNIMNQPTKIVGDEDVLDEDGEDMDKNRGRLRFPTDRLYGRDEELRTLLNCYSEFEDGSEGSQVVFLGGMSGTGKSALVEEFVMQSMRRTGIQEAQLVAGKFNEMKTGDPFSAIAYAMSYYIQQLIQRLPDEELTSIHRRMNLNGIHVGSDDFGILVQTLVPPLSDLLAKAVDIEESKMESVTYDGLAVFELNSVRFAFENLIKSLAVEDLPMIFFMDDLQWADSASLQLLSGMMKERSLKNVMFICAYRTNEVGEGHDFFRVMKEVEETRDADSVQRLHITNLAPNHIADFIADTIGRSSDEVVEVAEAVYTKTLGNIFFVKEALDELVRKNALYFDVVTFQWQFGDVSRVDLGKFLSNDSVEMVQAKLETLPEHLQKALVLAAYTKSPFDMKHIALLLQAESIELPPLALRILMRKAYGEGLVLKESDSIFKFAHDKIREATCRSVEEGKERDELLLRISNTLLEISKTEDDEWILFTAAQHLNSLPKTMVDNTHLAGLNLKVAKSAISKGAFSEAEDFLNAGIECLDEQTCWTDHYELTLELKNCAAETSHSLGHDKDCLMTTAEIFREAHSLAEKSRAQIMHILATCEHNNKSYSMSVDACLAILREYGLDLPSNPSDAQVGLEKVRFRMALRGRSMLCMSEFSVATDETIVAKIKVMRQCVLDAIFGKRTNVGVYAGYRMMRELLSLKIITKEVPAVVVLLGSNYRQNEQYEEAFQFASAGLALQGRFPEEKTKTFLTSKMALYATLVGLRVPFHEIIEQFLDLNRSFISVGDTSVGMAAGMLSIYSFFNAALPLNSLLEPKLVLFEEVAKNFGQSAFIVTFSLLRQCLYNLQGGPKSSPLPAELNGAAFNEVVAQATFEGSVRSMNTRDISIIRLKLAVLFGDEVTMDEMLTRLDEFPVNDMAIARQHMSKILFFSEIVVFCPSHQPEILQFIFFLQQECVIQD